ncbi:hypothetical protein [Streptomyces sp. NPDC048669]|uniref:hypothetical protein n=1 Tax=Streptomyces sp. NPDC048669 TaxID=3155267 RepID=UPI00342D22C0
MAARPVILGESMRTAVRAAGVAAALSLAFVAGCSSSSDAKSEAPEAKPTVAEVPADMVIEEAKPATTSPNMVPEVEPVGVGGTARFKISDKNDPSVTTTMTAAVVKARYVTAREIGAEYGEKKQLLVLTLTIKNIGHGVGTISTDGAVKWEDGRTSPRDATTQGTTHGPDLNAEYQPGQSVTGSLVLRVGRKGGTLSYIDDPSSPAFKVALPAT